MALSKDQEKKYWEYVNGENTLKDLESFMKEIEIQQPTDINELIHLKNERSKTALDILCELSNLPDSPSVFDKIRLLLSFSEDKYDDSLLSLLLDTTEEAKKVRCLLELYNCRLEKSKARRARLNRTLFLIEQALSHMSKIKDETNNAIFVFGKTRIGKSTFVNYLLGTDYKIELDDSDDGDGQYHVSTRNSDVIEKAGVGHRSISETRYPSMYTVPTENSLILIDMPGFDDNTASSDKAELNSYDIAASIANFMIAKKISSVQASLLLIPEEYTNTNSSNDAIINLMRNFLILKKERDSSILNNVFLVITKYDKLKKNIHVKNRLISIRKDFVKQLCETDQEFIKNFIKDLFDHWINNFETHIFLGNITSEYCRKKLMHQLTTLKPLSVDKFKFEASLVLTSFYELVQSIEEIENEIVNELRIATNHEKELENQKHNNEDILRNLINRIDTTNLTADFDEIYTIFEELKEIKEKQEEIKKKIEKLKMKQDINLPFSIQLQEIRKIDPQTKEKKLEKFGFMTNPAGSQSDGYMRHEIAGGESSTSLTTTPCTMYLPRSLPEKHESTPQILKKLSNLGLSFQEVKADGHCLYHAIGLHIGLDAQTLRNIIAGNLEHNRAEHESVISGLLRTGQTFDDYVAGIRGEEWGDDFEISLFMPLLNRAIVVVMSDGNFQHTDAVYRYEDNDPIFVYYNGHNHYDALILRQYSRFSGREILEQLLIQPEDVKPTTPTTS